MERLIRMVLECTLTMSVVAVTLLLLTPWLSRRYSARTLRAAWLIMLIGFIVPLRPQIVKPAITVPVPPSIMVYAPLRMLAHIPVPLAAPKSQPAENVHNAVANSTPASVSCETLQDIAWPELTIMHLLCALWLAGTIIILLVRHVQHKRFLCAVRRWSRPIKGTLYHDALKEAAQELGLCKTIGLYHCPIVDSPMLIGLFRPRILLPEKVKSLAELTLILRHELIHLRRHDLWGRLLLLVASSIHWFNPLMRPISHAFSVTCEEACDAAVTRGMTIDMRQYYSHTILRSIRRQPTLATALSTRYSGGKKTMKKRLTQILDGRSKKLGTVTVSLMLVTILGAGMALALDDKIATGTDSDNNYYIRYVDIESGKNTTNNYSFPKLNVTLENLSERLVDRNFSLLLPTVLPVGFSEDTIPEVSIFCATATEKELSPFRTGEPERIEIVDGMRKEYWKIPLELYDDFTEARLYWWSDSGAEWFGIIIRAVPQIQYGGSTMFFDTNINGFYARAEEWEGIGEESGPIHWRRIYLVTEVEMDRYRRGEASVYVLYELISTDIDMDVLLNIAEGLVRI